MFQRLMRLLKIGQPNKKVHDTIDWYTSENVQIQMKAKQLKKDIEENEHKLRQMTAFKVAVAAGRIH